jgi:2-aminoethylphosphonate-pyruvate transaminase
MQKGFTAVLLAAGVGSRLGDLTKETPKPLTPVNGVPLIAYTIAWVKALGAGRVVVVGGYMFDEVEATVHKIDPDIIMARNDEFKGTHRMVSLLRAAEHVQGDLLVQDADYLYHADVSDLLRDKDYNEITVHASRDKSTYTIQDVVIGVDAQMHLTTMYKTEATKPQLEDNEWYFNSLVYCPENKVQAFFDRANKMIEKSGDGWLHVEDVILDHANSENVVDVYDAGKPLWVEVDNKQELVAAERFVSESGDRILV